VIEVAKSSLAYDRGTKARLYAEAGAPEYWIVNLVDRVVEVHSEIRGGAYRKIIPHGPEATIAPASFPEVQIPLSQLLR
jgi:Uma2 family endonuclease